MVGVWLCPCLLDYLLYVKLLHLETLCGDCTYDVVGLCQESPDPQEHCELAVSQWPSPVVAFVVLFLCNHEDGSDPAHQVIIDLEQPVKPLRLVSFKAAFLDLRSCFCEFRRGWGP